MKLSSQGLHLIAGFEGWVPTPYNDSAGNATIGYGHLLHVGPVTSGDRAHYGTITVDQGLILLNQDAAIAVHAVNETLKVNLGLLPSRRQARFDALVSLAFNIGAGAFESSALLRQVNEKSAPRNWQPLGVYWLEWDHAGGAVEAGLLERRREEFEIFESGKYANT